MSRVFGKTRCITLRRQIAITQNISSRDFRNIEATDKKKKKRTLKTDRDSACKGNVKSCDRIRLMVGFLSR